MKTTTTAGPRRVVCFSSPRRFEEAKEAPIPPARSKNAPLYYNCTLEKGTHVEHSGDVIVVGNVEKDASITTENGDIVVFGSLRGEAIVRRRNKRRSDDLDDDLEGGKIFALDMRPEVLEIDETQMPPPEHLLDTGVNVKDKRAMTGIPMVAEKSERTGEITFSKFYGGASNDDDDAERYYERKEKNSLSAEQLERCKRAAMVTGTYILAVGVCLFLFPRRLFHAVVPIGETLSSAVWLRVVATRRHRLWSLLSRGRRKRRDWLLQSYGHWTLLRRYFFTLLSFVFATREFSALRRRPRQLPRRVRHEEEPGVWKTNENHHHHHHA